MRLFPVAFLAAACAWAADPAQVLSRAIAKERERAGKLPNYTCVETVTRDYYDAARNALGQSCATLMEGMEPAAKMKSRRTLTDRLRLDVTMTPQGEIYSWAGASRFEGGIEQVVRAGPMSTGAFGAMLAMVSQQDTRAFHFERIVSVGRRKLMEYSFVVEKENSHYLVKTSSGWVVVGYRGSLQIDPESGDFVQLILTTVDSPAETNQCTTSTAMNFRLVRIGDREFLLPAEGGQRFLSTDGTETENMTTFSGCKEYLGESTVSFGDDRTTTVRDAQTRRTSAITIPAGRLFTFELTTPISADTSAAGDAIAGKLVRALVDRNGRVIAPEGTVVDGRLLLVETRHRVPRGAVVEMKLTALAIGGVRTRFAASLAMIGAGAVILPPEGAGDVNVGYFGLTGGVMKAGARSDWWTVESADGATQIK